MIGKKLNGNDHSGCRLWRPNGAHDRWRELLLELLLLLPFANALRLSLLRWQLRLLGLMRLLLLLLRLRRQGFR